MVLRLPLLSTAIIVTMLLPVAALAYKSGCLSCHKAHYSKLGGCTNCHRGNDRTDRKRVAHDGFIPGRYSWFTIPGSPHSRRGEKLLDLYACRRCHTAEGKGNRLAADLDTLLSTRHSSEIALSIEKPAQCMPDFRLNEADITDLVNAILFGGSNSVKKGGEAPLVVHFVEDGKGEKNIFERKCGGCHRMLSKRLGGLGKGEIGPNLSGFMTPFYPTSLRGHEKWNAGELGRWLHNPRRINKTAQMPPVFINDKEFKDLLGIMNGN